MKYKTVLGIVIVAILLGANMAQAAKPEQKACVGKSVSAVSTQFGRLFGEGVSILAQHPELIPNSQGVFGTYSSLGEGVQALQSGKIPDFIVLLPDGSQVLIDNTCNN